MALSRREFLRCCGAIAAAFGIGVSEAAPGERGMAGSAPHEKTTSVHGRILRTHESAYARLKARGSQYSCHAENREQWQAWREQFHRDLVRELGPNPGEVPLRPEVLERTDQGDYLREKVIFDSEPFMSVPAWVLTPKGIAPGERRPGVLCGHGHGHGKNGVVGLGPDGQPQEDYNHAIAVHLVRQGYVTIAPDWRGFGERADSEEWIPREWVDCEKSCDIIYLTVGYFGFHMLNLELWDGRKTLDYLLTRKEVDPARLGCIGCSFGGTMATYLSALDERIKVAVICCYMSTLDDALGFRRTPGYCGVQYMPGLAKYGDISDVATLIAPRPLMVQSGERDTCFVKEDATVAAQRVQRAYQVIGEAEKFEFDLFPGVHEIDVPAAVHWFRRWL
jgi:dienelactone hydrolase